VHPVLCGFILNGTAQPEFIFLWVSGVKVNLNFAGFMRKAKHQNGEVVIAFKQKQMIFK
jgi:hypothetical protein